MANKKTTMSKLRISEMTGVSRNTFKKYIKIYAQLGLNLMEIEQKSDQELDQLFGECMLPEPCEKYRRDYYS